MNNAAKHLLYILVPMWKEFPSVHTCLKMTLLNEITQFLILLDNKKLFSKIE